ncbi:uncharacterized protein EI97DRAFT_499921 [Westerdykella ornata]|uniref:CUE domain-containing protein n=1 Tax=Westerdykella ornata TaxID=318751 RepID=A0A6A6JRZ6_WESOR|nr:uncharacterized protein EI97DRAFT_499921 [Westerdykella ornata]KAF2278506.1 hypothetical protein EI97DRAFT_499921 [Westerdykella ornata]
MPIPSFAPFPDAKVRDSIPPQEWSVYLESWTTVAGFYLRLNDDDFASTIADTSDSNLTDFLVSFFHELPTDPRLPSVAAPLRKKCFLILHRIWSGQIIPYNLLQWTFVSDVCQSFPKSERLRSLLARIWKSSGTVIEKSLQGPKSILIEQLDSKSPGGSEDLLNRLAPLLKLVPEAGVFIITGADLLDSLVSAHAKVSSELQKKLVMTAYLGLVSILEQERPNYSLLSDHLYSLKDSAGSDPSRKTFLADLVTNTPLLTKIRDKATSPEASRVKNIATSLAEYRQSSITRPKKLVRRKVDKGKGKAKEEDRYGHDAFGDVHVHRMSLITQIQDLFPDLGSGFVVKLLDEYDDNVEVVVAHLLEDSLPPHLTNVDRSEQLPTPPSSKPHFTPRSTPPPPEALPIRRNVFDNDEFDRLAVSTSQLHIGRKDASLTADSLLADRSSASAQTKASILSALALFDSDDDERDDTYDVEDVGGLVDTSAPDADDAMGTDKNDEALFRAYSASPEVFERDAETRRGKARMALRSETGMTDEGIEGWGIMVKRDPKRLRRLQARFSTFQGQQRELASTAYREGQLEDGEDSGGGQGQRGGRGGRGGGVSGRGRGRGGRGRGGGNVAGPSDDKGTQVSRQRKEANKGSRANHNRRDQRAKKMARGGFPG